MDTRGRPASDSRGPAAFGRASGSRPYSQSRSSCRLPGSLMALRLLVGWLGAVEPRALLVGHRRDLSGFPADHDHGGTAAQQQCTKVRQTVCHGSSPGSPGGALTKVRPGRGRSSHRPTGPKQTGRLAGTRQCTSGWLSTSTLSVTLMGGLRSLLRAGEASRRSSPDPAPGGRPAGQPPPRQAGQSSRALAAHGRTWPPSCQTAIVQTKPTQCPGGWPALCWRPGETPRHPSTPAGWLTCRPVGERTSGQLGPESTVEVIPSDEGPAARSRPGAPTRRRIRSGTARGQIRQC